MRKIGRFFFSMVFLCLLVCSAGDLIPRAHAASEMAASEHCVDFIKKVEGFSPQPYYDYNQYTVGYGTKCPSEKYFDYKSNGIPKNEAEVLLREELADIEDTLNNKLIEKYNLTLNQSQFDALVSFSFNIGPGWVTYDSSLRNAILRNADEEELTYAFGLYCTAGGKYLPGLVTRRLCEANMYLNGIYNHKLSDDFGYVYYDANGGTVTYRVQGFLCDSNSVPAADAVRNGEVFLGWYTDLTGGSQVSVLDSTVTGKTLFARWQSSENNESQAADSTTVRVTGDVVNIRSGPGTNYKIVKQIYRNEVLSVSHITHLTNMRWGKVQSGWICLDYTNYDAVIGGTADRDSESNDTVPDETPVPDNSTEEYVPETEPTVPPEDSSAVTGYVKVNDFLKIRSGPGTTYTTVGFLFNGNKVEIREQKTVGSTRWGRIADGWVCMDYITENKLAVDQPGSSGEAQDKDTASTTGKVEVTSMKGKITADALRIRSGVGTANPIVGFYYQNDTVVISEKVLMGSVYWGKTNKGWISMDYFLPDASAEEPSQPIESGEKTVIADCLRIRKDAGITHKIVGFLYYGDSAEVSETKDVDGTAWGKVGNGWVCMTYLK